MSLLATCIITLVVVWAYMTTWFIVAHLVQRVDLIDTAWGLGFILVAWLAWALQGGGLGVKLAAAEFTTLWGARLALHILSRNLKKSEDDHRYQLYRKQWGDRFWQLAYFRLFLSQGLLLTVISTTNIAIMTAGSGTNKLVAGIGFVVWAFGIVFEAEADAELTKFVAHKKPGEIMTSGLWKYSRHPNYFGEVSAWVGAAIVALSVGQWWGIIGAAVITFLITKVSGVPLMEKHYADNKAFQKYAKKTSIFVPLPPKT